MTTKETRYKCAVVGVGAKVDPQKKGGGHRIGYWHAQMYRENPRVDLVASADINPENLEAFNAQWEVPHGYSDYRAMLKEQRPDIVSLCTYVGLRKQMIVDSARAGVKAIFAEKPFVATPAELQAVYDVVKETGVKIIIAHQRRYKSVFTLARQLYSDGTIGKPVICIGSRAGWDLSEFCSHWLDMFRFFHNDVPLKWVMCQARVRDQRGYGHAMEDHAVAYFEFGSGAKGMVDGGCAISEQAMILIGTAGVIRINHNEDTIWIENASGIKQQQFTDLLSTDWHDAFRYALNDLIQWIEGGPEPRLGLSHTGGSSELNLAAYLSAIRCDRIDLPLDLNAFPDVESFPVDVLAKRNASAR